MKGVIYIIFALGLSACSSNVISFYVMDESDINYTTFSFYARDRQSLIEQKAKLDSLIENVITNQLLKKGYTHTSPSEMYILYKIMSNKTFKTHSQSYYDPTQRFNNIPYNNYTYVTERKEGVLMIDLYDKNDKLIWQGTKAFKAGKSTDIRALLISHIELIMADFKSNL